MIKKVVLTGFFWLLLASSCGASLPAITTHPATLSQSIADNPSTRQSSNHIAPASAATLDGIWDLPFGTLELTQQGAKVEGRYEWYGGADAGRVQGIVLDTLDQFRGLWISERNPNSQGFLRWKLAPDRNSFTGVSERGNKTTGQWCGVRSGQSLPPGCGFSGNWQLRFGSPPNLLGQASLVQTGSTVQGTYTAANGNSGEILDGIVTRVSLSEARLTGTWRNNQGEEDSFDWRLNLMTGQTFQGRRDPGNSEWCGWREGAGEPDPCGW